LLNPPPSPELYSFSSGLHCMWLFSFCSSSGHLKAL
jgi:hypothetical protein